MLQSSYQLPLQRSGHMNTLICRTCGCSLVRLGISPAATTMHEHQGEHYPFCCTACAEVFRTDPERYLVETSDLIVCPTCLAEKPIESAVTMTIDGQEVHLCRCPYCAEVFKKNPEFYIKRLEGIIPYDGVLDHEGCCVRP